MRYLINIFLWIYCIVYMALPFPKLKKKITTP